jgi:hypothetical protein
MNFTRITQEQVGFQTSNFQARVSYGTYGTFVTYQGAWRATTLAVVNLNRNLNLSVNRSAILEQQLPV